MFNKLLLIVLCILPINFASAKDYYGAIYVDQLTGIAGVVIDYPSGDTAKKAALKKCKLKSGKKKCEYVAGWYNSCAAAAWSNLKKSARRGNLSDNQKQAEFNALNRCQQIEKDQNCKLVATACTTWETWETTTTTTWW